MKKLPDIEQCLLPFVYLRPFFRIKANTESSNIDGLLQNQRLIKILNKMHRT